ncbi:MAG: hypothetical protein ACRESJ_21045, partial [Pseudomonas sp.]|uniref:hypothetical protein n=1 Tax=Pseudomonas sp. TaxID=306 RepID=UPI003D6E3EF8
RASLAPTGYRVGHKIFYQQKNCGSGLAREEAGTATSPPQTNELSNTHTSQLIKPPHTALPPMQIPLKRKQP